MIGAIIGGLMGIVGFSTLIDNIADTDITAWFIEKIASVVMLFLKPLCDMFMTIYDAILSMVTGWFT